MGKILVVDDERGVLDAFRELLGSSGHVVVTEEEAEAGIRRLKSDPIDLVIMDVCLPGISGLEALHRVKAAHPRLPVIVMTGRGTVHTAVEATKLGAFDYHLKPLEPDEMLRSVAKALQSARLMRGQVALGAEPDAPDEDALVGRAPAMLEVYKAIGRVAQTEATVLVRGESGTGKELAVRAIYQHSLRADKPLTVVHCAAIPETLLESELFGYEPGAFTGASTRRIGKFEQAHGGTVFLDEIGEVSPGIQAKLLRVLQDKTLVRLGSNQPVRADVRVLAATNRDLEKAMAAGEFREDLFHRLNVVCITMPPLRDHREDIPAMVRYFLARYARELKTDTPAVSPDALELLVESPWPGNVRELEHCIQRAMIFTRGHAIQAEDLRPVLGGEDPDRPGAGTQWDGDLTSLVRRWLADHPGEQAYQTLMDAVERRLLSEALDRTGGNQSQAARLLGIARPTLHGKLQKHGLRADEGRP